jgi:hypothetical protein
MGIRFEFADQCWQTMKEIRMLFIRPVYRCLIALLLTGSVRAAFAEEPPLPEVRLVTSSLVGTAGFFRVGQDTGKRWWLVTPEGKPFFYRGATALNRSGRSGGRRAKPGPYSETVDRKYGYAKSTLPFVRSGISRLRQWGFNALGAWTTEEFFDQGMPYTEIVEFNYVGPQIKLPNIAGANVNLPDVFDPAWERAADEKARLLCTPRRASRDLVGYFTDNELGWAQPEGDSKDDNPAAPSAQKAGLTLLQQCLCLPSDQGAYKAAWAFALARHRGDSVAVARAWGVPSAAPADILAMTKASEALVSEGYRNDCRAFSEQLARRYFETTSRLIRKYDPNHLILGCRFGAPPGPAVLAACRRPWVDVLSANNYRDTMQERIDSYYLPTKMPILIGEFAWSSGYFTREIENEAALRPAPSVPERAVRRGETSLRRAATHPGLIGYTWYRWVSAWDKNDLKAMPYGLVDLNDDPIGLHTDPLSRVNPELPGLHVNGGAPK